MDVGVLSSKVSPTPTGMRLQANALRLPLALFGVLAVASTVASLVLELSALVLVQGVVVLVLLARVWPAALDLEPHRAVVRNPFAVHEVPRERITAVDRRGNLLYAHCLRLHLDDGSVRRVVGVSTAGRRGLPYPAWWPASAELVHHWATTGELPPRQG